MEELTQTKRVDKKGQESFRIKILTSGVEMESGQKKMASFRILNRGT